jgi:hypothetical protein
MATLMGITAKTWLYKCASFILVLTFLFVDVFVVLEHGLFTAAEAEASTGDYAVFAETTGTEVIAGIGNNITWDNSISTSANIALQGNTSDIDLADGGKYLVLYNVWTEQGAAGGANRRSIASYLTLDDSPLESGWGGGYIRDSENDFSAYNSGAAIIDAAAGADLAVVLDRDDANATGGSAIKPGTNGVSVLKLAEDLDYLRIHKSTRSADISGNTTFTAVTFDTSDEVDTGSFAFSEPDTGVTISGAADRKFLVTTNVKLNVDGAGGPRQNYELRLTLDGVEVPGTRSSAYIRFDNGDINSTLQYTGVIQKTNVSDQVLAIEVRREGPDSASTDIVGDQTALSIVALPEAAEVLSLSTDADQTLTAAQSVFTFGNQISTSDSFLSHSTTTASDDIAVDTDGDYLVFATTYTSRISGTGRDVPRIEWLLDGVTQSYGGHGHFNRGDQSTDDAFTSGGSGGAIFPGLTSGQTLELVHSDETTGTPNADFVADRVAVQVLELSELIPQTSTDVSVLGSQVTTLAPGTVDINLGEQFVIVENDSARNVTSITVSEDGTVAADTGLQQVRLYYDLDTSLPYDCASESYGGGENQFGATSTFSGADGTIAFTASETISPTQTMCVYVVADIDSSVSDGETVNVSIASPTTDVVVTSGGTVGPPTGLGNSFSTITDAEITQTNYHWRNDDGSEVGATSATGGVENTPGLSFDTVTPQRLRLGIAGEGTGTESNAYRLEFAEKVTACAAITTWTDVDSVGGAWDMFDSANVAEAGDTTNISIANGGVSDGVGSFVTPNGGVRDVTSQTGLLSITADDFTELEYSIQATGAAVEGVSYCFRVTDAGSELRAYTNYPEATLNADITVAAAGAQITTTTAGGSDVYVGGLFSIVSNSGSFTLTDMTVTETGTIDAEQYLSNLRIAYDVDTTNPRDCASESYGGAETELIGSAFNDPNGTSSVTLSESIQTNRSICAYVLVDIASDVPDAATIDFEISLPNTDVVVTGATVGPGSAVTLSGSTLVEAAALTQENYHWRNDDGDEAGATSATGGVENTPINTVLQGSFRRLRMAVSNEGSASAAGVTPRLEYGTKVTTCENVGSWERVATGAAFDMHGTSQLVQGNDTTNIAEGVGGISNPNTTFVTPNAAQLETTDQLGATSLTNTEYVELEYALEITDASAFGATYCFRVSDGGTTLASYVNYPELNVQERQDFLIQSGTETVSGTSLTLTAGVDYNAPSSNTAAYVRISNTSMTGAGSDTLGAQRNSDDIFAYIENGDDLTTSFSIVRPSTATDNTHVSWEIVEYIGIAAADNEMIVRAAGEVTYGTAALFATGTAATGVADDSDVVVFITGQFNPDTTASNYNAGLSLSSWDAAGDQPVFERGDADGEAARVSYAVVEFTGASWNVQRAEHTFTAAGVAETEPIVAVNSLLRTFVHAQKLSGDELFNLDESGHEVWLSSIGAVSFQLEGGATNPSDHRSVAWVIENTQTGDGSMGVYRSSGLIAATTGQPNIYVYSIGATVSPSNASIWATNRSTGAGNFHPRAVLGARVLSATQFELWKSDEGQSQNFRVEVVEWPVAETSIRQTHYRFYVDNDALTPTDPWPAGASDLGENTTMTDLDEPLGESERTRIRLGLFINNASLVTDGASFKLQYARRVTSCSAIGTWDDVSDIGGGGAWRAYDGTPADDTELLGGGALLLSVSNVAGTYEENSPSAPNPNTVAIGDYVEYDWVVENNAAVQKSSYCFRVTESDGTVLAGYDVYPTVRTSGYTPVIENWRWYTDETNLTPVVPAAGENVAPSAVIANEELKLRVSVTEVEGAPDEDIKFNLEYSQYPDFRDATTVGATTSCSGDSLWCYADGTGEDNVTIDTSVLSGVDSCVAGVGDGCGTYNEATAISGVYNQSAFTTSEHEFTVRHDGARVNGVYYFRLFDATNGVALLANTAYPSLTTEGAILTFSVSGLDAETTIEGITTDATTTATRVDFGSLPLDADIEAAQRLTVFTNGTEGYRVYMNIDQDLTDSYGNTIASVAGTNDLPATWASQCTGVTTGCFGYHVGDNALYDGSVRFALDDTYAGVESGPVEVMASTVPVTFDVSDIIYRTRVSFFQTAGEYNSTIQYIVVPIF